MSLKRGMNNKIIVDRSQSVHTDELNFKGLKSDSSTFIRNTFKYLHTPFKEIFTLNLLFLLFIITRWLWFPYKDILSYINELIVMFKIIINIQLDLLNTSFLTYYLHCSVNLSYWDHDDLTYLPFVGGRNCTPKRQKGGGDKVASGRRVYLTPFQ